MTIAPWPANLIMPVAVLHRVCQVPSTRVELISKHAVEKIRAAEKKGTAKAARGDTRPGQRTGEQLAADLFKSLDLDGKKSLSVLEVTDFAISQQPPINLPKLKRALGLTGGTSKEATFVRKYKDGDLALLDVSFHARVPLSVYNVLPLRCRGDVVQRDHSRVHDFCRTPRSAR